MLHLSIHTKKILNIENYLNSKVFYHPKNTISLISPLSVWIVDILLLFQFLHLLQLLLIFLTEHFSKSFPILF